MFALYGPGILPAKLPEVDPLGYYPIVIQWGVVTMPARPAGPGFWGPRIPQPDRDVDDYELQLNPANESYYLPHPNGGYVQFENVVGNTLQDAKLVKDKPSIYHVDILPPFASESVLKEAERQVQAATANGFQVQWLVSDKQAAAQLKASFERNGVHITVVFTPPEK
jgi:hypothetical protein